GDGVIEIDEVAYLRQPLPLLEKSQEPLRRGAIARLLHAKSPIGFPPRPEFGNLARRRIAPSLPRRRLRPRDDRIDRGWACERYRDAVGHEQSCPKVWEALADLADV